MTTPTLQVHVTDEAAEHLRARGGVVAVDYIAPAGCGKTPEIAFDTHLVGKDTSGYHRAVHPDGDVTVWVSPALARQTHELTLGATRRWWRTRLTVDAGEAAMAARSCTIGG